MTADQFRLTFLVIMLASVVGFFEAGQSVLASSENYIVTVLTDRASYVNGDDITLSGKVLPIVPGNTLSIFVFGTNQNLLQISQILAKTDGTYSETIHPQGPLWNSSGTYTVKVQYGLPNNTNTTSFFFQSLIDPRTIFLVKDPNSPQTFVVNYNISGGSVKNMTINPQGHSLIISLNSTSDGSILLQLPRSLIDAKTNSGQDSSFTILIDGRQVLPESKSATNSSRNVQIKFDQGDKAIEIVGTSVIGTCNESSDMTCIGNQTSEGITLSTDKSSYFKGDTIYFSGTVGPTDAEKIVNIVIHDPDGKFVSPLHSVLSKEDGTFLATVGIDQQYSVSGTYTATAFIEAVKKGTTVTFVVSNLYCGKPSSAYAHVINGTDDNDNLVGTNENDLILGYGGNDTISGLGGDDCLLGGAGNDTIYGGPGNDYMDGGSGDDKLYGGAGNDTIYGANGNDYINAGDGDDKIYGGAGDDEIHGMDGNDYINAGDGDDKIYGGAGNDEIHGMDGNDYINGGDGTDSCFGGTGINTVNNCNP